LTSLRSLTNFGNPGKRIPEGKAHTYAVASSMKSRFHVVDVTEEPNLTLTRQQQDMRNRGFVFAVIDGSDGTAVSLHKTQARAEAVADLHNERDSNQQWLG